MDKLIKNGLIKFHIRYKDDILVLAKEEVTDNMKQFHFFDNSAQFTIDRFGHGMIHFLDIKINDCIIKLLILECTVIFHVKHLGS